MIGKSPPGPEQFPDTADVVAGKLRKGERIWPNLRILKTRDWDHGQIRHLSTKLKNTPGLLTNLKSLKWRD